MAILVNVSRPIEPILGVEWVPRGVSGSLIKSKIFVAASGNNGAHRCCNMSQIVPFKVLAPQFLVNCMHRFISVTGAPESIMAAVLMLINVGLAFVHDIDLSIQTLVVDLNNMFLLRFLNNSPDICHVPGF